MKSNKQSVTYHNSQPYETLNTLTEDTENIWFIIHGMGYLSRYFLRYFKDFDSSKNYFIAPQAPSKYYLKDDFKHVGASWLTKEETDSEILNILRYLDAVFLHQALPKNKRLILLGFSQGVSVALRWCVARQLACDDVILYAGGIPNEITQKEVSFLNQNQTQLHFVYRNKDQYITQERLAHQKERINELFIGEAKIKIFDGTHEVKPKIIQNLIS